MSGKISKVMPNFPKERYMMLMADKMPILRRHLGINQGELAELIGASRQMISLIERKERVMLWDTFMSLIALFRINPATRELVVFMEIYTDELHRYLKIT